MKVKNFGKYISVWDGRDDKVSPSGVEISWGSLGSVDVLKADSFLKELDEAIDYAMKLESKKND